MEEQVDPPTLQAKGQPQRRPRGRPPLHTGDSQIQRRREQDRTRQARKRERDRMKRRGNEVPEVGVPGVGSSAGNSITDPRGSALVSSIERRGGLGPSSSSTKRGVSVMTAAGGIDGPVRLQPQIEGPVSGFPGAGEGLLSARNGRFPPTTQDDLFFPQPIAPHQIPVSLENATMTTNNSIEPSGGPDESPMIGHTIQRIAQALEASRSSRAMREQLAGALYTSDFVRLTDNWEAAGITTHPKPLPPPPPPTADSPVLPTDAPYFDDKMEERMMAIKKRKGLKKEVEELRRALAEKEATLKEYDAVLEAERAGSQSR